MNAARPRVLFVIAAMDHGGAEHQIARIAPRLQGHMDMHVLTYTGGRLVGQLRSAGVNVNVANRPTSRLAATWREMGQADVTVSWLFWPNLICRLMAPLRSTRLLTCIRSVWFGARWRAWALRLTRNLDDGCIVNSSAAAKFVGRARISARPARLLRNLVESPAMRVTEESQPHWLCVGQIRREKNQQGLVDAIKQLPATFSLRFVGSGPGLGGLQQLVMEEGLADRVDVAGPSDDVWGELVKAAALILPSFTESSPNVLLEAILARVGVVASDIPAIREIVGEDYPFLFNPRDSKDMATVIQSFFQEEPAVKQRWAATLAEKVGQQHGSKAVLGGWRDVLLEDS